MFKGINSSDKSGSTACRKYQKIGETLIVIMIKMIIITIIIKIIIIIIIIIIMRNIDNISTVKHAQAEQ